MLYVHANLPIDPHWVEWLKSPNDLTLTTITTLTPIQHQKQARLGPIHIHATMQPQAKLLYVLLVSIPICKIKHKKEWHWSPNNYLLCDTSEPSWLKIFAIRTSQSKLQTDPGKNKGGLKRFMLPATKASKSPDPQTAHGWI
jgi:hypothetical protein